jgi:hypothetical protein
LILTYATITNWFSTEDLKICVGEKTASSTNGAGKTGFLHAED